MRRRPNPPQVVAREGGPGALKAESAPGPERKTAAPRLIVAQTVTFGENSSYLYKNTQNNYGTKVLSKLRDAADSGDKGNER